MGKRFTNCTCILAHARTLPTHDMLCNRCRYIYILPLKGEDYALKSFKEAIKT